jgi:hypothetical protein
MIKAWFFLLSLWVMQVSSLDNTLLESEVDCLISLGSRRTGSPNKLIVHIHDELESLRLEVFS